MQQEEVSGKCPNAPDSPMSDGDWDDGGWDFDNRTIGVLIVIGGGLTAFFCFMYMMSGDESDLTHKVALVLGSLGVVALLTGDSIFNSD